MRLRIVRCLQKLVRYEQRLVKAGRGGGRQAGRQGEVALPVVLSRHKIYKLLRCAIINFSLRKNAKFIYTI